jgi:membrane protein YqaA with SNARE-associated domain
MLTALASMGLAQMVLWCFGLAIASAVFPWVNAEIIVLSLPALTPSKSALLVLVLAATAGQMTGKCAVYWAGRKGNRALGSRAGAVLLKWRDRLEARPSKAAGLILLSSVTGLPPFYVVTLIAGALKMNFSMFVAMGTVGRLLRFGALVTLPHLALSLFQAAT